MKACKGEKTILINENLSHIIFSHLFFPHNNFYFSSFHNSIQVEIKNSSLVLKKKLFVDHTEKKLLPQIIKKKFFKGSFTQQFFFS